MNTDIMIRLATIENAQDVAEMVGELLGEIMADSVSRISISIGKRHTVG